MNLPKSKLSGVSDLLEKIKLGSVLTGGLPGILGTLLGAGSVKDKVLKQARSKMDAQEARTAGKELAFASHKFISAVAAATPAEQRTEATELASRAQAAQYLDMAEECIRFAPLAIQREATRGKNDAAEKAALEAREAGELRMLEQGIDIGRVANGDAPKMGAVA